MQCQGSFASDDRYFCFLFNVLYMTNLNTDVCMCGGVGCWGWACLDVQFVISIWCSYVLLCILIVKSAWGNYMAIKGLVLYIFLFFVTISVFSLDVHVWALLCVCVCVFLSDACVFLSDACEWVVCVCACVSSQWVPAWFNDWGYFKSGVESSGETALQQCGKSKAVQSMYVELKIWVTPIARL